MKSRMVIIFYDAGDPLALRHSLDTFLVMNASHLNEFKIIVHLLRPDNEASELIQTLYSHRTPYLTATTRPPCIPCILKRHKVRYGIVIPPGYRSIAPLWSHLDEIRYNLRELPDLTHIRLFPDTDLSNTTTHKPLVYHYHTYNIMIGNGNLRRDLPILVKSNLTQTPTSTSGVLKPIVFRKD